MADHLVSRFLGKCITVETNYQPSHQASTIVSTCYIYTGDKNKRSSANCFTTIATAASLLWLSRFGLLYTLHSDVQLSDTWHLDLLSSGVLRSADWYLFTDVSVQRFGTISNGHQSNKNSEMSYMWRQKPEITHVLYPTFLWFIHQHTQCCYIFLLLMKGLETVILRVLCSGRDVSNHLQCVLCKKMGHKVWM
jgi:hypothetical protein